MARMTLGVIFGNRDFFPDHLVTEARRDISALFSELNITPIMLDETATKLGGVETWNDSKLCADLFRRHAAEIDGVLVCLPNFGDEKGVADTIKLSGLNVPILVQAYPDNLDQFMVERRRDAFCANPSAVSMRPACPWATSSAGGRPTSVASSSAQCATQAPARSRPSAGVASSGSAGRMRTW